MSEFRNSVNDAAASAAEMGEEIKDTGREALRQATGKARDFTSQGLAYAEEVGISLSDFARRQPWVALTGAFLVGYVTARVLRRLSM